MRCVWLINQLKWCNFPRKQPPPNFPPYLSNVVALTVTSSSRLPSIMNFFSNWSRINFSFCRKMTKSANLSAWEFPNQRKIKFRYHWYDEEKIKVSLMRIILIENCEINYSHGLMALPRDRKWISWVLNNQIYLPSWIILLSLVWSGILVFYS